MSAEGWFGALCDPTTPKYLDIDVGVPMHFNPHQALTPLCCQPGITIPT